MELGWSSCSEVYRRYTYQGSHSATKSSFRCSTAKTSFFVENFEETVTVWRDLRRLRVAKRVQPSKLGTLGVSPPSTQAGCLSFVVLTWFAWCCWLLFAENGHLLQQKWSLCSRVRPLVCVSAINFRTRTLSQFHPIGKSFTQLGEPVVFPSPPISLKSVEISFAAPQRQFHRRFAHSYH